MPMPRIDTVAGLLSLLLISASALAQDNLSVCRTGCESDQRQCRSDADGRAITERYPPLPNNTEMQDRKRDMRAVLNDKQLADEAVKSHKFERYDLCTKAFFQCLETCRSTANPEPAPNR